MFSTSFRRLVFTGLHLSNALAAVEFNWAQLKSSTKLNWIPCYDGFQCSLLQVPLDYTAPQSGNASIAIVRLPATSPKSEYRGPLLFNPGGPGSSGVDAIVQGGAAFATVFGDQFDIVGFDPRGVSYSTPIATFFKTDVERELLIPSAATIVYPSLNASSDALAQVWGDMQLLGQLAVARNTDDYLQHMTTDNIARDMLRITEAFGYEKLQYWGVSYGSVLGATFASLFPDKVGRLIIDGVFDMDAYYTANLTNQCSTPTRLYRRSSTAAPQLGPDNCAFYASSTSAISDRLAELTASIRDQPFPVVTAESHGIVDFVFLRNSVLDALFSPYDSFEPLAQGLAALAGGNATALYALTEVPTFECGCNASAAPFHANNFEAYMTIACGDALPVNDTIPQLQRFYENGAKVSSFSDLLSSTRVVCAAWKIHREDRFQGPVGAQNTSFPLLLVGNTLDPVTPLAGAMKTAKAFPGSALLTQDAVGHTSLTAPSMCTFSYFRQYFVNGTLPPPGTVCSVDAELFPDSSASAVTTRGIQDSEAERLLEAGRTIRDVVRRAASRAGL